VGAGSLSATLAWTDPPASDGSLVHDLDLQLACDVQTWAQNLGNGGASADRVNTVEKISLLGFDSFSSGLCIASITANGVSAMSPQPFSLVVAGPFVLSQCEAQVRPPNCVQGVAEQSASGWRCRCFPPYLGPFCDQDAMTLELQSDEAEASIQKLRAWQWSFFSAPVPCAGDYSLVIDAPSGSLQMHLAWGHLHTSGSGLEQREGITFDLREDGSTTIIQMQITEAAFGLAHAATLGLQWRDRSGESSISLQFSSVVSSCGAEKGLASEDPLPVVLAVGLGVALILAAIASFVCWRLFRGRPKVSPPGASPDMEAAEGNHVNHAEVLESNNVEFAEGNNVVIAEANSIF